MEQSREQSDQMIEFQAAYSNYLRILRKLHRGPDGYGHSSRWCSLAITHAEISGNFALDAISGVSRLKESPWYFDMPLYFSWWNRLILVFWLPYKIETRYCLEFKKANQLNKHAMRVIIANIDFG